jgi:hypothetical protein
MSKTGPRCTVCASDHRHRIEIGLVAGMSARALADRFDVSKDAIHRHAANHLTEATRAGILAARKPCDIDLDALRADESAGLLSQLVTQRARLLSHGDLAATIGDVKACVAVEGAITANLALVAKMLGQLVNVHDVRTTNLLVSPDYLKLRSALVAALRPFPAAKAAVVAVIQRLESDAAVDITAASDRAKGRAVPMVIDHVPPPAAPPAPPY